MCLRIFTPETDRPWTTCLGQTLPAPVCHSPPTLTLVPQPWDTLSIESSPLPAGPGLLRPLISTKGQQALLPRTSTGSNNDSSCPHPSPSSHTPTPHPPLARARMVSPSHWKHGAPPLEWSSCPAMQELPSQSEQTKKSTEGLSAILQTVSPPRDAKGQAEISRAAYKPNTETN